MRVRVTVELKPGVLDPEAEAIRKSLHSLGYDGVHAVRRQQVMELDLDASDSASARERAVSMCDALLANPVIETYRVDIAD